MKATILAVCIICDNEKHTSWFSFWHQPQLMLIASDQAIIADLQILPQWWNPRSIQAFHFVDVLSIEQEFCVKCIQPARCVKWEEQPSSYTITMILINKMTARLHDETLPDCSVPIFAAARLKLTLVKCSLPRDLSMFYDLVMNQLSVKFTTEVASALRT